MATQWQRARIQIPQTFGPSKRRSIATDIIDFIQKRSRKGISQTGTPFPSHRGSKANPSSGKYSARYVESAAFKSAGKSKSKVNLTLSSQMLSDLKVISTKETGSVLVGFQNNTLSNSKADGNQRGTYGKSRHIQRPRRFLGISSKALSSIISRHK